MENTNQLTAYQFTLVVTLSVIGNAIIHAPSLLMSWSKQDAWIAAIIGILVGAILILLYTSLAKRYPKQTFTQYTEIIAGKWPGKIISIFFFTYLLILSAYPVWGIVDFLKTYLLSDTSEIAICVIALSITVFAPYLGLKTIGRLAELLIIPFSLLLLILILTVLPNVDLTFLRPILEKGWGPVFAATFTYMGFPFTELIVFLFIFPFVTPSKKAAQSFLIGTCIGGAVLAIIIFLCIAVLGIELASVYTYPTYVLAQKINIGNFLQRIEGVLAIIWFISQLFQMSINFYATVLSFSQIISIKTPRTYLIPIVIIITILALTMIPDIQYAIAFSKKIWAPYSLICCVILPMFLLIIDSGKNIFRNMHKS
ncbi:endospore germination permease [Microbacteriaceae bacterium 4G12]